MRLLPFVIILFQCINVISSRIPIPSSGASDRLSLLSFKSLLSSDPQGALASWNDSLPFCQWNGVTCGRRHPERVTALDLGSLALSGPISPSLGNLTFLRRLYAPSNRLHGRIPPELGQLFRMQHLNLSSNELGGGIPETLSRCSNLRYVSLSDNHLQGEIPSNISRCRSLQLLDLSSNMLQGAIPAEFGGSLPKINWLIVSNNNLDGGIPPSLGNLTSLTVLALDLNSLTGSIPPSLAHLSSLAFLGLGGNALAGGIPPSLGRLSSLVELVLRSNSISGGIPDSLGNLTSLVILNLGENKLTGNIPTSLANLSSLTFLRLRKNALTGGIPPPLGRISSLAELVLGYNSLLGGIPPSFGGLFSLTVLDLSHNNLSSTIPSSIYNLSGILYLDIADNKLLGVLPPDLGLKLPNLQGIYMYWNQIEGPIPASLANASRLRVIELSGNNFSGEIPANMGALQSLAFVLMARNQLRANVWRFFSALTNCSRLQNVELDGNNLGGTLPSSLANLSTHMEWLSLGSNGMSGSIPSEIGNLINLNTIFLHNNLLTGSIPPSIGKLRRLDSMSLFGNLISGEIPSSIGNLTRLNNLYLERNDIRGSIPTSLGNCRELARLGLSDNSLTGLIPREVVSIPSLSIYLDVAHNTLFGSLPVEVGSLKNLNRLDVSYNQLSGEIPNSLGSCQVLEILLMNGNSFQGTIPPSLANLKGVQYLDLSHNNLSGNIPRFLGGFSSLTYLNLSFNNFEGEVPKEGVFRNVSAVSVLGNPKLCGGNPGLHLPPCPLEASGKKHKFPTLKVIAPVVAAVLCVIVVPFLYITHRRIRRSRKNSQPTDTQKDRYVKITYAELLKATDGFSSNNLIGAGSFGSVYKGVIMDDGGNEKLIAVKVLNLQQRGASKNFMAECEAMRTVRHRNLIKISNVCLSMDFRGNDFKALVFEFMPNGSLEKWLHPPEPNNSISGNLDLLQRLNIAIDVASALNYLHHHCHTTIVHCDLKPSNILLDDHMTALVSDFGLARFLSGPTSQSSVTPTSSIVLRGSIGYVAPEYGMGGHVSTNGDVYSFGILLLEMFTGKRPTDDEFKDNLNLHKFVATAFPERVMDVVDPQLLSLVEEEMVTDDAESSNNARGGMRECFVSVVRIGLSCSKGLPRERMNMEDVVKEMCAARDTFLGVGTQ